ncbi:MAG TPA: hypothetical protein VHT05_08645 [Candidatus Elarobacter sp.]|nr:hypothetical protein [Candidatus Elarobacter sp.]
MSSQVFTMMLARQPRALLAALGAAAVAVCAVVPAAPADSATPSTKKTLTKTASAKKPAPKKVASKKAAPKKQTGYHPHNGPAPADEYFGRLGMSVLGVRSKVKDLGLDADLHPEHDPAILNNALWVEDAMRDWAKKYPFDRWLPRYAYALEQMYEEIPGDVAHKRAVKQISYITAYFPQTLYARVGRAKLAQGIPEPDASEPPIILTELDRLALIDGKVVPTLPPAPGAVAAATPAPTPVPEESPGPASAIAP